MKKMVIVTDNASVQIESAATQAKIWAIVLGDEVKSSPRPEPVRMNKKPRRVPDNYGKAWTADDDAKLYDLRFVQQRTGRFAAKQLGRTYWSVVSRVNFLKNKMEATKATA